MKNERGASSTTNEPKKTTLMVKAVAFLFCIGLGYVATRYVGIGYGILFGVATWVWLYSIVLKDKPKTREEVLYEEEMETQRRLFRPYAAYVGYFFLTLLFGNAGLYAVTRNWNHLFFVDVVASIVFLVGFYFLSRKQGAPGMKEIAGQMGLDYAPLGDVSSVHQNLHSIGKDIRIKDVFSGTLEGYPVRIFDFYYTWMKDASNMVQLLEVTNNRLCPSMLIISKQDSFGETFDASRIFSGVAVDLEGDFSKYFSVYVEQGSEDEVRQFLTPDMMAVLIDTMPELSVLFFGDKLYVSLATNVEASFSKKRFEEQIEKVRFILSQWSPTLSRIKVLTEGL